MGRPKTAMFKTADLVGLDVLAHVARNTYELVVDDDNREHYKLPDFVHRMVDQKLLGNKTKSGFYKTELTPEGKKIRKEIDPETLTYQEVTRGRFSLPGGSEKSLHVAGQAERRGLW